MFELTPTQRQQVRYVGAAWQARPALEPLMNKSLLPMTLALACLTWSTALVHSQSIDFSREVRPIFSRHCFKCHGPDEKARKGKLRLDLPETALRGGKSGQPAIVPAKPQESEVIRRIFADDDSEVMPPPATRNPLANAQKQILKKWIAQGAEYKQHWAFIQPTQAPLPKVQQADWPRNAIDYFVLARLEAEGLSPSPPADRYV